MAIARRFLIASSLTRLIRKERGSERVTEGHFPPQSERQSHVRIDKGQSYLVLTSLEGNATAGEDWTEVPRSHAEALLDVCPGTVIFERSRLRLRNHEALVDRFITPGPLDIVSVEFASQADADAFLPPVWFGMEVTGDDSYTNRMIAVVGRPHAPEAPLSNAALETALDLLESRPDEGFFGHYERSLERQSEDSAFERLRRLAAVRPASPLPSAPVGPLPSVEASPMPSVQPAAVEPTPVEPEPEAQPEPTTVKPPEGVARLKPRRPSVQTAQSRVADDADDRLAGVIQGLSEALSKTSVEKDERFGS
jgi:CYTH domain-containing protein